MKKKHKHNKHVLQRQQQLKQQHDNQKRQQKPKWQQQQQQDQRLQHSLHFQRKKRQSQVWILIRILSTIRCGSISMRKPRLDEDRSVALGRSSVARHRWCNCAATGFALSPGRESSCNNINRSSVLDPSETKRSLSVLTASSRARSVLKTRTISLPGSDTKRAVHFVLFFHRRAAPARFAAIPTWRRGWAVGVPGARFDAYSLRRTEAALVLHNGLWLSHKRQ